MHTAAAGYVSVRVEFAEPVIQYPISIDINRYRAAFRFAFSGGDGFSG